MTTPRGAALAAALIVALVALGEAAAAYQAPQGYLEVAAEAAAQVSSYGLNATALLGLLSEARALYLEGNYSGAQELSEEVMALALRSLEGVPPRMSQADKAYGAIYLTEAGLSALERINSSAGAAAQVYLSKAVSLAGIGDYQASYSYAEDALQVELQAVAQSASSGRSLEASQLEAIAGSAAHALNESFTSQLMGLGDGYAEASYLVAVVSGLNLSSPAQAVALATLLQAIAENSSEVELSANITFRQSLVRELEANLSEARELLAEALNASGLLNSTYVRLEEAIANASSYLGCEAQELQYIQLGAWGAAGCGQPNVSYDDELEANLSELSAYIGDLETYGPNVTAGLEAGQAYRNLSQALGYANASMDYYEGALYELSLGSYPVTLLSQGNSSAAAAIGMAYVVLRSRAATYASNFSDLVAAAGQSLLGVGSQATAWLPNLNDAVLVLRGAWDNESYLLGELSEAINYTSQALWLYASGHSSQALQDVTGSQALLNDVVQQLGYVTGLSPATSELIGNITVDAASLDGYIAYVIESRQMSQSNYLPYIREAANATGTLSLVLRLDSEAVVEAAGRGLVDEANATLANATRLLWEALPLVSSLGSIAEYKAPTVAEQALQGASDVGELTYALLSSLATSQALNLSSSLLSPGSWQAIAYWAAGQIYNYSRGVGEPPNARWLNVTMELASNESGELFAGLLTAHERVDLALNSLAVLGSWASEAEAAWDLLRLGISYAQASATAASSGNYSGAYYYSGLAYSESEALRSMDFGSSPERLIAGAWAPLGNVSTLEGYVAESLASASEEAARAKSYAGPSAAWYSALSSAVGLVKGSELGVLTGSNGTIAELEEAYEEASQVEANATGVNGPAAKLFEEAAAELATSTITAVRGLSSAAARPLRVEVLMWAQVNSTTYIGLASAGPGGGLVLLISGNQLQGVVAVNRTAKAGPFYVVS